MATLRGRVDKIERRLSEGTGDTVLYGVRFGPCTHGRDTEDPTDWAIQIWYGPGQGSHVDARSPLGRRLIYALMEEGRRPCGCSRDGAERAHSHLGQMWSVTFAADGSDLPPVPPEDWELPPWPHTAGDQESRAQSADGDARVRPSSDVRHSASLTSVIPCPSCTDGFDLPPVPPEDWEHPPWLDTVEEQESRAESADADVADRCDLQTPEEVAQWVEQQSGQRRRGDQ